MTIRLSFIAAAFGAVALAPATACAQDANAGETIFKRCAACHAVGSSASDKAGPELDGA